MGHIKAFCKEKPIRGGETGEANVAFTATDDSNIWLSDYEVWGGEKLYVYLLFSLCWYSCVQGGVLKYGGQWEHQ